MALTNAEKAQRKREADKKRRMSYLAEGPRVAAGAAHPIARLTPLDKLTEKQRIAAKYMAEGRGAAVAARMAGFALPESIGRRLTIDEDFQAAVMFLRRQAEAAGAITRKRVMDGFVEAIDMARLQADPTGMISGWREIAKMCGYYAPEVKKIDLNVTTKRVIDKLETMSEIELAEIIESSAKVVSDAPLLLDSTTSEEEKALLNPEEQAFISNFVDDRLS
jgi:hypothetical protein